MIDTDSNAKLENDQEPQKFSPKDLSKTKMGEGARGEGRNGDTGTTEGRPQKGAEGSKGF